MYVPDGKYIAIYPIVGTKYKVFYNLYDHFNPINVKSNNYNLGDRVVDLDNAKLLIEYLDDYKIAITDRYLKYKKLLYITVPITQYETYKNSIISSKRDVKFGKKYVNSDIYHSDFIDYNGLLEKKDFHLLNIDDSEPVSYGKLNDEIPYILKRK